jgi:hypothetical protein
LRLTRRERIKLLLETYSDAYGPSRNPVDVRVAMGSRPPSSSELWKEGSYREIARGIDSMRDPYPKITRHLVAHYCSPQPWVRKQLVEKGFAILEKRLPMNLYVPQDISEKAGFTPAEAKSASKRMRVAA